MPPDYDLAPTVDADTPRQLKAIADPSRHKILDLVLERAATVTELATALGRPKSSVAYHVDVLVDAGLLTVVRSRKVRAIEERYYGRVGRTIVMSTAHSADGGVPAASDDTRPDGVGTSDLLAVAHAEAVSVEGAEMRSTMHHARISRARAAEFFDRVAEVAEEFMQLPLEGDEVFGFVAAVYLTDRPTLPPRGDDHGADDAHGSS